MLAIQDNNQNWWVDSGSDWWVNSIARFAGGQIGHNVRSDTTYSVQGDSYSWYSVTPAVPLHQRTDSFNSTETAENQASQTASQTEVVTAPIHMVFDGLRAGHHRRDTSDVILSAIASQIQIIAEQTREHQLTGLAKLGDDQNGDYADDGAENVALTTDQLRNATLVFSATTSHQDRSAIVSMLD